MPKKEGYKRLDPVLQEEITNLVIRKLREEETKLLKSRHDKKRANVKLVLRRFREIEEHVNKAVHSALQAEEDLTLQDLLELMGGGSRDSFRIESIRESAAKSRLLVTHMHKMIEAYKEACERSEKDEEKRRYRVLYKTYISPEPKTADEIAQEEYVDKSTIYRDIDAAADKLAVLFFGVYGLKFL